MNYILGSAGMKACDTYTIQEMMLPSMVLMERAAFAVVEQIKKEYTAPGKILIVCGSGNNGGDGFAVARLLLLDHIPVNVWFVGKETSLTEETGLQKKIFEKYGGEICKKVILTEYTLIVDAIFGIGLSREITGACSQVIAQINQSGVPVLAIDMPSGICADTGQVMGCAVRAERTVTFAFEKTGQILYPGTEYCGRRYLADIGITDRGLTSQDKMIFSYDRRDLDRLPIRRKNANKGTYGKTALIGGTIDMAGAVLMAGRAAYRSGCGLVRVVSHPDNRIILQSGLPEAVFSSWETAEERQAVLDWTDVVGIGPGLGTSEISHTTLRHILEAWAGPCVVDADGLNMLSVHEEYLLDTKAALILTPHPGEMARLLHGTVAAVLADPCGTAKQYAKDHDCICVLKGARTVVSDGVRTYLNQSGNEGMAVGGSGDVLTGVICGLLAQGMEPFEAACLGVYVHGCAGDAAALRTGSRSMMAGDIITGLAEVWPERRRL